MDFQFIKNRYDFELQRKEQLTDSLALPVAILTALGSTMVAMARSFSYRDVDLTVPFASVLAADLVAFFLCLLNLGRA